MIRRTRGISRPEPAPHGHTVPLSTTTAEERDRASRYAANHAIDADDLRLLLAALGLTEEDPYA